MKRTLSEVSGWQGDEEEPLSPRSTREEAEDKENSVMQEIVRFLSIDKTDGLASTTRSIT